MRKLRLPAAGAAPGYELEHEQQVAQDQRELEAGQPPAAREPADDRAADSEVNDQQRQRAQVRDERHTNAMLPAPYVSFKRGAC